MQAGGLGCQCDVHLRVDRDYSDRQDDNVRTTKRRRECRYVGILGGSDAHGARSERLVLFIVFGFLDV